MHFLIWVHHFELNINKNDIPTTRFKQVVNKRKYDGPVGISCSKSLIPKQHHAFYESLAMISNEECTEEEDVVLC